MKKTLTICIIIMVIIGAGSFWGGMAYGQTHRAAGTMGARGQFGANGAAGLRGTRTAGGFVTGSIISMNGTSATISLPNNGGSKIVLLASSTAVLKTTAGSPNDLQTGTNVMVQGTTNSDGSITAQNISIRPAGMMGGQNGQGGMGGNGGQQPSPTATK